MTAALRVDALAKRYGSTLAVQGVSFTVERGQVFGLLGPNGSGKTTTLACALGLQRPDSGHVEILGTPSTAIHRTAGRVGVVFDDATLLPGLGVRGNLEYAAALLGHRGGRGADEALDLVGLSELRNRRAGRLSLGQGRRLSIARALLGRPELLVLDEPLSGLDTVGVREVLALFRRLSGEGLTLVLSSHRLHEMELLVSHVAILLRGRLAAASSLEDLLGATSHLLHVTARPVARARETLERLSGIASVSPTREAHTLLVDTADVPPATVSRALHEAGCDVDALVPERRTLQAAFEALLDESLLAEGQEVLA